MKQIYFKSFNKKMKITFLYQHVHLSIWHKLYQIFTFTFLPYVSETGFLFLFYLFIYLLIYLFILPYVLWHTLSCYYLCPISLLIFFFSTICFFLDVALLFMVILKNKSCRCWKTIIKDWCKWKIIPNILRAPPPFRPQKISTPPPTFAMKIICQPHGKSCKFNFH